MNKQDVSMQLYTTRHFQPYKPILKFLVPKWNEKVWLEDLPIKLRRQKVIDMNFKDFIGLPEDINERVFKGNRDLKLPIPRLLNSSRDKHPLKNK